ncbi:MULTISPECIES: nitrite reductase large subunit NirB [Peribacillus]|uniref:Nitrite reductase large subunit NirB n=1 Tax=Peribacillus castrilensis TaxID=2897690 RepID=A0AAW9NIX7_9BACI|nr:nitrite reductase large subunit NirB [Peribacillus frigoritolerans]MEC0275622.1 nitrite reductase large subunit NirB [Peribacillus castrilensis]MEC0298808.1 nitrite reductase large subunit NirB [Peribacillus castrilensis]MEC0345356.1 nitrite reductase large subunit NirB [Peribacillus castrilensis]TFH62749.1 NAD(P)/FAD-dependent oxidoreductase [Peribacillus frigoritolerans]
MSKQKLALIGNGMAGVRCIEEILKIQPERFEVTVFGSEPHPNYDRIQLSNVLQGATTIDDITINDWNWYKENNITLFSGETVTNIDTTKQIIYSDANREVAYDRLILATGSIPFILPIKGADKKGVTAFRNIEDCEKMIEYSKNNKKAAVIGGGLLGLEAARGLLNLGMQVDVIHLSEYLMDRQLDPAAGKMLQRELESQGMNFYLGKQTQEVLGEIDVKGLRFSDGEEISADLVVMAVGIKPNVAMAKNSCIPVNRGIIVNDYMETRISNIFAVGECAEHREMVYGLVAPLYEQGKVLAKRICGLESKAYEGSVLSTKLKISGVDVFSAGEIFEDEQAKSIKEFNEWNGTYKKVMIRNGKISGAVLFGDTKESNTLLSMINKNADVSEYLNVGTSEPSVSLVTSMSNEEIICGCNGVTKGDIVTAIESNGLTSIEEVKGCTSASRSCGGCKPLVGDILELTLGADFSKSNQKESICTCTTLSRDEVVAEIREKNLTHTREVMNVLGWNTSDGCSKCKPALNYYLGMIHPVDYEDEKESRYVNERLHANIQKDGTFSVVPRMYGGVTNPDQLRKIANVADKYNVKLLKVTGGQRIDLFGVEKEDLPSVWADLDMPSGYAYGKTLRTVKTCVGENFCRFGTQDSIGLGIAMEKKFERVGTPHKVKMAVSACPRNCAESGIKDLGVVGVDGAWEIYIGGNGGTHLRAAELLCKVKTSDEVIEITGAYIQHYRETANYLERTSFWVERVGFDTIKEIIGDKQKRMELNQRLDEALSVLQEPWKEIIESNAIQTGLFQKVKIPAISNK